MKIGKLVWDKEHGRARVELSKKFHSDMYGHDQLDAIKDIRILLDDLYNDLLEEGWIEYEWDENYDCDTVKGVI
jgi:hypothetical protein